MSSWRKALAGKLLAAASVIALAGCAEFVASSSGDWLVQEMIRRAMTSGRLATAVPAPCSVIHSSTNARALARVDALKFIVSVDDADYRAVGEVGQSSAGRTIPVYVQPMDVYDPVKNAANSAHALGLAQKHGYFLSTQMHKVWGIA